MYCCSKAGLYRAPHMCSGVKKWSNNWQNHHCVVGAIAKGPPEIEELSKIVYVHIPKCGSSIATTLIHYACENIPKNMTFYDPHGFNLNYKKKYCKNNLNFFHHFESGHESLPPDAIKNKVSIITMFRDPYLRMLSGYYYNLHDCQKLNPKKIRDREVSKDFYAKHENDLIFLKSYFECVQHMSYRMVHGINVYKPTKIPNQSHDVTKKIIQSIKYFGLQDKWSTSICLFHRMFGGDCLKIEFHNARPGSNDKKFTREVAFRMMYEKEKEFDHWLFQYVHDVFFQRLIYYDVNLKTCTQICPGIKFTEDDFMKLEHWS